MEVGHELMLILAKASSREQLISLLRDAIKEYEDAPDNNKKDAFSRLSMMCMIVASKDIVETTSMEELNKDLERINSKFNTDVTKN